MIREMLKEKSQRIFIWEAVITLFELFNTDIEARKDKLREVVQRSNVSLNSLDAQHNPYRRALRSEDRHWQLDILKENEWKDESPTKVIAPRDDGKYYSTLAECDGTDDFRRNKLFGRHRLDVNMTQSFIKYNRVGLYGTSGAGSVLNHKII